MGKLGGGSDDEDFGHVEFEAGSPELEITAVEKLRTLAAGAEQRPELILQVEGAYDPEADSTALREAAFKAVVAERQPTGEEAPAVPPSLELLEALYLENASDGELSELRARHVAPSESTEESVGEAVLDETAYYRELKAALVAVQPIDPDQLMALGSARTEAIRTLLVDESGIDPSRVEVLEPEAIEPSGDRWVRCRLDVASGD